MELGRGYIEHVDHFEGDLRVSGWMMLPGHAFEGFELQVDGEPVGTFAPVHRPELIEAYGHVPDSEPSGFYCTSPQPAARFDDWTEVRVVGVCKGGGSVGPSSRRSTATATSRSCRCRPRTCGTGSPTTATPAST